MQQSVKAKRVFRPYSPSKWYECWLHRIHQKLSHQNKFYRSLNETQSQELHSWIAHCFMKMDMLLLDHDNHAIQMQWTLHDDDDDRKENQGNFTKFHGADSVHFVSKHALPKALMLSTESPIGYVNFKKYRDFVERHDESLFADLMDSDLGPILEASSAINDNEDENPYFSLCHPRQRFWTPKYEEIEGYPHPIWEVVDSMIEYLYRMSIYFHEYDRKLVLSQFDGDSISDRLIHVAVTQCFAARFMHRFDDTECPNPSALISEHPPSRLCAKYSHIPPSLFSDLFRIVHLNGYINQTLYLRHILGHGLYSMSSFFDHSCDPNLVYAQFEGKLRMVLVKEVKAGETLTTSYLAEFVDQIDSDERKERCKWLGFQCRCTRCLKEEALKNKKQRLSGLRSEKQKSSEFKGSESMESESEPQLQSESGKMDRDEFPPTIWSELRFFHHVLSEGIETRWESRLFRWGSFGRKDVMTRWFMKERIRTGIVEPSYECFHTMDVLGPDAALNDILCVTALKKFKHKYWDRTTFDRELSVNRG